MIANISPRSITSGGFFGRITSGVNQLRGVATAGGGGVIRKVGTGLFHNPVVSSSPIQRKSPTGKGAAPRKTQIG